MKKNEEFLKRIVLKKNPFHHSRVKEIISFYNESINSYLIDIDGFKMIADEILKKMMLRISELKINYFCNCQYEKSIEDIIELYVKKRKKINIIKDIYEAKQFFFKELLKYLYKIRNEEKSFTGFLDRDYISIIDIKEDKIIKTIAEIEDSLLHRINKEFRIEFELLQAEIFGSIVAGNKIKDEYVILNELVFTLNYFTPYLEKFGKTTIELVLSSYLGENKSGVCDYLIKRYLEIISNTIKSRIKNIFENYKELLTEEEREAILIRVKNSCYISETVEYYSDELFLREICNNYIIEKNSELDKEYICTNSIEVNLKEYYTDFLEITYRIKKDIKENIAWHLKLESIEEIETIIEKDIESLKNQICTIENWNRLLLTPHEYGEFILKTEIEKGSFNLKSYMWGVFYNILRINRVEMFLNKEDYREMLFVSNGDISYYWSKKQFITIKDRIFNITNSYILTGVGISKLEKKIVMLLYKNSKVDKITYFYEKNINKIMDIVEETRKYFVANYDPSKNNNFEAYMLSNFIILNSISKIVLHNYEYNEYIENAQSSYEEETIEEIDSRGEQDILKKYIENYKERNKYRKNSDMEIVDLFMKLKSGEKKESVMEIIESSGYYEKEYEKYQIKINESDIEVLEMAVRNNDLSLFLNYKIKIINEKNKVKEVSICKKKRNDKYYELVSNHEKKSGVQENIVKWIKKESILELLETKLNTAFYRLNNRVIEDMKSAYLILSDLIEKSNYMKVSEQEINKYNTFFGTNHKKTAMNENEFVNELKYELERLKKLFLNE